MLKNEGQAISILAFLVENWREARTCGWDYEPIDKTLNQYLDALAEGGRLSKKEVEILYLKSKIKATEKISSEKLQGYRDRIRSLTL